MNPDQTAMTTPKAIPVAGSEAGQPVLMMRDGYIPVRKRVLIETLSADNPDLANVFRLLAATLNFEAQARVEGLKDLYHPLDPDAEARDRDTSFAAFDRFETSLVEALTRANFHEIDHNDVRAHEATRLLTGLKVKTSVAGIRRIRYFARGAHGERVERKLLLGLSRKIVEANVFSDVVVFVGFKSEDEIGRADRKAFAEMRRGMRPGAALVKHFRNVAMAELVTLHPGARPSMQNTDRLFLGVPAIAGGVPVLANLWPALTVLFAVIAAYFGAGFVIDNERLTRAVGALGGLVALIAFVMRQRLKVEAQSLKYQKRLADTVYFRNIANNAGVLDLIVGAGEEQDEKEACLAYWALTRAGKPLTKSELDKAVEDGLRARFSVELDFEIGDAIAKLERLGLIAKSGDLYQALPPSQALEKLDSAWDNYFKFAPNSSSPT